MGKTVPACFQGISDGFSYFFALFLPCPSFTEEWMAGGEFIPRPPRLLGKQDQCTLRPTKKAGAQLFLRAVLVCFFLGPVELLKPLFTQKGLLGKNSAEEVNQLWKACFLGVLMPRCFKEVVWRTLFGQGDWHCFRSLPICFKFHNPYPGSEKPETRGRDRKPGRPEPLDQLPCQ